MRVYSTNIGEKRLVKWGNKEIFTGIFKSSIPNGIVLMREDVKGDNVIDRKYHGGIDKACYAYSHDSYSFWEAKFPELEFEPGMFGENLTIEGLDESVIKIGNQYNIGEAVIEVSQPRQPCFKLGIRFDSQTVLKEFIQAPFPGIYLRVLKTGLVKSGDRLKLIREIDSEPTVLQVHQKKYQEVSSTINRTIGKSKYLSLSYFD